MKLNIILYLTLINSICTAQVTLNLKTIESFNTDTITLLAKRDTVTLANGIRNSITKVDTSLLASDAQILALETKKLNSIDTTNKWAAKGAYLFPSDTSLFNSKSLTNAQLLYYQQKASYLVDTTTMLAKRDTSIFATNNDILSLSNLKLDKSDTSLFLKADISKFNNGVSPLVITAITTNPVKGTVVYDKQFWTNSFGNVSVQVGLDCRSGASNGSGDYLFELPNGYSFDTNYEFYTTAPTGNGDYLFKTIPCYGIFVEFGFDTRHSLAIVPYDATHYRILMDNITFIGSGVQHYSLGSSYYSYSFSFKKI